MEALLALIGKADNVAVLVLLIVSAGLGWAHIVWRKEDREDRKTSDVPEKDRVGTAPSSVVHFLPGLAPVFCL